MTKILYNNFSIAENFNYGVAKTVDYVGLPFEDNSMVEEFKGNLNVTQVNNISNDVTNMISAFEGCTNLQKVSNVPNSVTSLSEEITHIYGYGYDISENDEWKIFLVDEVPSVKSKIFVKYPWQTGYTSDRVIVSIDSENTFTYSFLGGNTFTATRNTSLDGEIENVYPPLVKTVFGDSGLTEIPELHNGITQLRYAFSGCTSLDNVTTIPNSVTDMSCTFEGCTNLKHVVLPTTDSYVTLYKTFSNCTSLANAPAIPNNVSVLYETFSGCTSLVNVPVIPNSVIQLGWTFSNCSSLVNTPVIPNSVTDMAGTFEGCTSLVNAPVIPNSVTNMYGAFWSCRNLVNAPVIPNNVTDLSLAFLQCDSMVESPNVPSSVTNIASTFEGCYSLVNAHIESTEIADASQCFARSNMTGTTKNVYIPYTYANNEYTTTYNSFIAAGYDENGTTDGVYLKDINA